MNSEIQSDIVEIEYKKADIKPVTEDPAISGEMPIDVKINELDVEIEAKRSGPKSAAQTPAKQSEKRKGSSKNKPGSAGEDGSAISFSAKLIEALKAKVKKHNADYSKKVSLNQLKKVFRRGAGAFSSSHRPGVSRTAWGLARVNMFLNMMAGKKVKDSYKKADIDISKSSEIDFLYEFDPSLENFSEANKDIEEFDLFFEYNDIDEIYLDTDENNMNFWYEL